MASRLPDNIQQQLLHQRLDIYMFFDNNHSSHGPGPQTQPLWATSQLSINPHKKSRGVSALSSTNRVQSKALNANTFFVHYELKIASSGHALVIFMQHFLVPTDAGEGASLKQINLPWLQASAY